LGLLSDFRIVKHQINTILLHTQNLNIFYFKLSSCVTFWVVLWHMVFNIRCFSTLCLFHLHIFFASTCLWRWNRHSVLKHQLLNTIRWKTTQKVTHDKTLTVTWYKWKIWSLNQFKEQIRNVLQPKFGYKKM
jgi:hypothetical protein